MPIAPNGMPNGMPAAPNGMPNGMPAAPNGMPNGMPAAPNGMPNGMPAAPNGIPNGMPGYPPYQDMQRYVQHNMYNNHAPYGAMPGLHCVDIASHIEHCFVCAKMYRRDYNKMVMIITVLVLIVMYLLTKLIDKR